MATELDVYRDWLGIAETARPLSYYQLLRLKQFEDNPAKIREHYRKMNAHVRKFAAGDFAKQSQDLLNELAKAMLCLTDAQRKREYDATLGRKDEGAGKRRTLEEILLAEKAINPAQLEKARNYAKAIGLEIRDALVQQKAAAPDVVMLAYAESIGLPFIDLADVGIDEALVPQVPSALARAHSCAPVMCDGGQLLMASPNPLTPDVEEELRLRLNMPVRTILCTPVSINAIIAKHYAKDNSPAPVPVAKKPATKKGPSLPSMPSMPSMPKVSMPTGWMKRFRLPRIGLPSIPLPSLGGSSGEGGGKNAIMPAILAFNMTVMVVVFTQVYLHKGTWTMGGGVLAIGLAVVLGSVVAFITLRMSGK